MNKEKIKKQLRGKKKRIKSGEADFSITILEAGR